MGVGEGLDGVEVVAAADGEDVRERTGIGRDIAVAEEVDLAGGGDEEVQDVGGAAMLGDSPEPVGGLGAVGGIAEIPEVVVAEADDDEVGAEASKYSTIV